MHIKLWNSRSYSSLKSCMDVKDRKEVGHLYAGKCRDGGSYYFRQHAKNLVTKWYYLVSVMKEIKVSNFSSSSYIVTIKLSKKKKSDFVKQVDEFSLKKKRKKKRSIMSIMCYD